MFQVKWFMGFAAQGVQRLARQLVWLCMVALLLAGCHSASIEQGCLNAEITTLDSVQWVKAYETDTQAFVGCMRFFNQRGDSLIRIDRTDDQLFVARFKHPRGTVPDLPDSEDLLATFQRSPRHTFPLSYRSACSLGINLTEEETNDQGSWWCSGEATKAHQLQNGSTILSRSLILGTGDAVRYQLTFHEPMDLRLSSVTHDAQEFVLIRVRPQTDQPLPKFNADDIDNAGFNCSEHF